MTCKDENRLNLIKSTNMNLSTKFSRTENSENSITIITIRDDEIDLKTLKIDENI